jgi:hypothetical protein
MRKPGWRGVPGYLHYDANPVPIVDNLSDFAHLAFVRARSGLDVDVERQRRFQCIDRLQ